MRVIAGKMRGRRLKSPPDYNVRPTSDKVKEAVFSILTPYIGPETICMDVFAGAGSMGIEAISRGAKTVYFSDIARSSLSLVRENLSICGASDSAVLICGDFKQNIRRVKERVDIFFLDPPYAEGFILPAIEAISAKEELPDGCIVVCEHPAKVTLPESIADFTVIKDRRYGATGITIYQKNERNDETV